MDDEKIISDRTLEIEGEERAEQARASKLPDSERDADTDSGSTLTGDALPGAVSGGQSNAEAMGSPHDDTIMGKPDASMPNAGRISDDGVRTEADEAGD